MSVEFGLILAVLTLGSCCASYWCGQQNMLWRMRRHDERRRERQRRRERDARWAEFDDED